MSSRSDGGRARLPSANLRRARGLIDEQGFAWTLDTDFVSHFAGDIDMTMARVMYAVQQPVHTSALEDVMATPRAEVVALLASGGHGDEAIPARGSRAVATTSRNVEKRCPTLPVAYGSA
jgi:hypothetical protein